MDALVDQIQLIHSAYLIHGIHSGYDWYWLTRLARVLLLPRMMTTTRVATQRWWQWRWIRWQWSSGLKWGVFCWIVQEWKGTWKGWKLPWIAAPISTWKIDMVRQGWCGQSVTITIQCWAPPKETEHWCQLEKWWGSCALHWAVIEEEEKTRITQLMLK